jgi:cytoskeletal protein CcmA (bactofilin family)
MSFWTKQREETSTPAQGADAPSTPPPAKPSSIEEPKPMAMLKREDISSVPAASGDLNALLGRGSEFEGKLTFEGTVRIDGKFTGTIVTNDVLVVGDRARIDADITCGTVIVHGEVNGNIRAKNAVELHAPARVRGDVETPSFSLERGVVFQGQTTMPSAEKVQPPARAAATGGAPRAAESRPVPIPV